MLNTKTINTLNSQNYYDNSNSATDYCESVPCKVPRSVLKKQSMHYLALMYRTETPSIHNIYQIYMPILLSYERNFELRFQKEYKHQ